MKRVIEVAHMLNVSKVTIYKKMSALKADLKPFIVKEKNVTYLTDEAVEILRDSLQHITEQKMSLENSEQLVSMQDENYKLRKELDLHLKRENESVNSHLNDMIMVYDYLMHIKEKKDTKLETMKKTVQKTRQVLYEVHKQIELFEELIKQES